MIRSALAYVVLAVVGFITALVGATAYRAIPPFGVILCIFLMLVATTFARSWKDWNGIGVFAGVWAVMTFLLSLEGPGGSHLITTDTLALVWTFGGALAVVLVCLIPAGLLYGRENVTQA